MGREIRRERVTLDCEGEGRTKQSFTEQCNINNIMARYRRTGEFTHVASTVAAFGDFSNVGDFKEAVDAIAGATREFMRIPAEIRDRFDNDPARFVEFVLDEANAEEVVELGLAPAPKVPPPPKPKAAEEDPPPQA